ncbi:U4/u6.u5 tri-snrnp-associated protein 1 [Plakobranchus ocellatus]|uniref:U4/u6.u5 tri-snrnp-associated protein 1 n=1 Tax=Plakobranchus ocellatus TaxID=259542 RepID=A0AAV4B283_9GAST|nr:U4/u6.u5 tri-snrnp-associated protein 1 [Plakobranchus ocellatus]
MALLGIRFLIRAVYDVLPSNANLMSWVMKDDPTCPLWQVKSLYSRPQYLHSYSKSVQHINLPIKDWPWASHKSNPDLISTYARFTMGSKKHKDKDKESKRKRKHRSRSKSPRDKEKKRRHRERSRSRSRSHGKDREASEFLQKEKNQTDSLDLYADGYRQRSTDEPSRSGRDTSPSDARPSHQGDERQVSGDGSSLSIAETNRIRAELGLKPLDVPETAGGDDSKPKKSEGVHVPAVNMADQRKAEALREKLATKREKRMLEKKMLQVKGLGDSDSGDEGAAVWVQKSRKMQREKELAEKRAKMLEEMDEDFGIGGLVEEEFKKDQKKAYRSQDLSGLRVEHAMDKFEEGRGVILTLKDKGILDEEQDDVLINVNIEDDERAEKNVENKKKKPDYKPYDEPQYDEYGMMKPSNLLSKYDEEIEGAQKESFTLGSGGSYDAAHEKRMAEIRQQLKAQGQSLTLAAPTLATEYMTKEEAEAASFKKVKKKVRKIRKKEVLKADDLLPLPEETNSDDFGSRTRGRGRAEPIEEGELPMEDEQEEQKPDINGAAYSTDLVSNTLAQPVKEEPVDDDLVGPDEDLLNVVIEEDEAQNELQGILAKARKLKLKKERNRAPEILEQVNASVKSEMETSSAGANIVLNSTSEFCRNLGEIPTYGLSGNREEDRDEIMDMELELMDQKHQQEEQEEITGGWNEVDIDENPVDIKGEETSVLEEEPIAGAGVGAALALAQKKGFIEDETPKKMPGMSSKYLELQAQNYTIQDKRYDDLDEKNRKRERYQGGMVTDFKEKDAYKPEVKLDYVDESGRSLSQKEAFRQLSHRFHGKGSGKKKTEKRGKKVEEELLMKRMSSTDTPLNTLSLLQDKQRSEKSPFIVLSGSRGFTSNTIVKPS